MTSPKSLSKIAVAAVILAVFAASCASDDSSGERLEITDDMTSPNLVLTEFKIEGDLTVPTGQVEFSMINEGMIEHNVALEDGPLSETLFSFDEGTLDLGELAAGDYVLYCDIDGHRTAGMETTLTVLDVVDGMMVAPS